jgi:hypothetical protein
MGLPQHVDRMSLLSEADPAQIPLYAVVTPDPDHSSFDAEVVDMAGNRYLRLHGYRTVAVPGGVDVELLKKLQNFVTAESAVAA